jgi:hypothetical protein
MTEKTQPHSEDREPDLHTRMRKRNRVLGLSLGVFVIALMIISYFRIKGLTP